MLFVRLFDFCLFGFVGFQLPLGVWEGLRFMIVALPELFSYLSLTICLWLGPPWFNYWFSFTLAYSRISHEYSSLFIIVINLIIMYFCIKSSIGTQGEVG